MVMGTQLISTCFMVSFEGKMPKYQLSEGVVKENAATARLNVASCHSVRMMVIKGALFTLIRFDSPFSPTHRKHV